MVETAAEVFGKTRHATRANVVRIAQALKSVQSSSSFDAVEESKNNAIDGDGGDEEDEGDIQGIREITRALEEYLQGSTLGEFSLDFVKRSNSI